MRILTDRRADEDAAVTDSTGAAIGTLNLRQLASAIVTPH
jgi:glycine betaine/proline transport system ATP-binding protein